MLKDKKVQKHLIGILIGLALALMIDGGWGIFGPTLEPRIIIRFHNSGLKLIQNIIRAGTFGAGCIIGPNAYQLIKDIRRIKAKKKDYEASLELVEKQLEEEQRKLSLATPEGIYTCILRARYEFYYANSKAFHSINAIKEQLDEMNELQEKLDKIFVVNDMADLGDARNLLQDIEDAICMTSTKHLINYYIIGGENALFEHAEQTISDNELLLTQARGILADIVEYINGDKTIDDISNHIAIFRKTIQNFMKEENENEAQLDEGSGGITLSLDGN